ncbi:hypothetical protein [Nocardia sp. NPDC057030]|uniref:hypothetical protein n=1 Tax=unclassified Nocardia TaxID=2637762 RepID=UPI003634335F
MTPEPEDVANLRALTRKVLGEEAPPPLERPSPEQIARIKALIAKRLARRDALRSKLAQLRIQIENRQVTEEGE